MWTTPNHVFHSVSVWRFFIWAWLPCSLGIFWFRSTLFGTTNFVKWTMTQLRLTKPHWLSWKILSPPVFESFLEIWHWVWETVKSHILFIRCIQPILSLQILFFYNYLFLFQLFKKSSMAPSSLFISQLLKKGRQRNSEIVHLGLGIWGTKQKIIFFIAKMQISNFKTK